MTLAALDVFVGGYVPGASVLHTLDPRTKVLGLIVMLIGVFVGHSISGVAAGAAAVLMLGILSRVGWRIWIGALSRFRWMLAMTAAVNLFIGPGSTPLVVAGHVLPIFTEAIRSSIILSVQLATAIGLSMVLTFTTTPHELTKGCERLARPLKRLRVPVEDLAIVILMAMRFIPLFQQELRHIIDAQKARGVDFGHGSAVNRAQNLVAVLMPAILGTLRRGDRLADAMANRGFRPGEPRSEFRPLVFSARDWVGLGCALGFSFLSFILR
jgi:energy-coupling factor transport system permease protein